MEVRIYDDYPENGGKLIRTVSRKELYARTKKGKLVEVEKKNQIAQHDIMGDDDAGCQVI